MRRRKPQPQLLLPAAARPQTPRRRHARAPWPALAALACAGLLLAGCASSPILGSPPPGANSRADLHRYAVSGKLRTQQGGGSRSANFSFSRNRSGFALDVSGPLGIGKRSLRGSWDAPLRLRAVGGKQDGREFYLDAFGLPDAATLEGWLLCLRWGRDGPIDRRPQSFTTPDGWDVHCQEWHGKGRVSLPGLVQARRDGGLVTLQLRRWDLAGGPPGG